jgi:CRISPR type IV-associated protein Csf3
MIQYDALKPYVERLAALPVQPLRITLELVPGSRLAGYDALNLDNLLARAVVDEATEGRGLPSTPESYELPVPLQCLWRSPDGFPLWAATPFMPMGLTAKDIAYWHKRAQSGCWTGTKRGTFSIRSTQGRWMERRVPLPNVLAGEFSATCIGNADEIARLLTPFGNVGKRRSCGFGEIRRWRIERVPAWALIEDKMLTRSLPALALELLPIGQVPDGLPAPVGWTPPQWKPSLFAPGWWAGTPVAGALGIYEVGV